MAVGSDVAGDLYVLVGWNVAAALYVAAGLHILEGLDSVGALKYTGQGWVPQLVG